MEKRIQRREILGAFRQLVYVSSASFMFTDEQLDLLLQEARHNNDDLDITGLLVYAEGSIMQVIEGARDAIDSLFEKISADTRHTNVTVIADFKVDQRDFPTWRMAFAHEPHPEPIDSCVNLFRSANSLHADVLSKGIIGSIMAGFISRSTYLPGSS